MKKKTKYSNVSIRRIARNIKRKNGLCPSITANAMQSINHQNCVLIIEDDKE